jgi:predicted secreted Zn-dependent protease
MFNLLAALAATAAVQAAPPAAPPPAAPAERTLSQIPGVTIKYYDVSGKNAKELQASIDSQRPKDPTGKAATGGFNWNVKTDVTKSTQGNVCTVSAAHVQFEATAELPRLADPAKLDPRLQKGWNDYVHGMDTGMANQIGFFADRMGDLEKALVGQSCDNASPALDAAIERLKAQEQTFAAAEAAKAAAAAAVAKAQADAQAKAAAHAKRASDAASVSSAPSTQDLPPPPPPPMSQNPY